MYYANYFYWKVLSKINATIRSEKNHPFLHLRVSFIGEIDTIVEGGFLPNHITTKFMATRTKNPPLTLAHPDVHPHWPFLCCPQLRARARNAPWATRWLSLSGQEGSSVAASGPPCCPWGRASRAAACWDDARASDSVTRTSRFPTWTTGRRGSSECTTPAVTSTRTADRSVTCNLTFERNIRNVIMIWRCYQNSICVFSAYGL